MTAAEKLRQEGKRAGELLGVRRLLLRQLSKKFGPLPAEVEARVSAADEATLEVWGEAVLTAQRIEDVWSPA